MEILRYITWYDKVTNKLVGEFRIDQIVAESQLHEIFKKYKDDPLLYMVYDISKNEAEKILKHFDFSFDFDKFIYNLDCYQK